MAKVKADVAIVGGGTAGCSTALHLRQQGLSVVLLERRGCGSQASGVNYGGVRQQGRSLVELPLSSRSRRLWDRLPALVGSDCEFMTTGHLRLARSDKDMAVLEAWNTAAREYGVETELFGRNAIRDAFPYLGERVVGGSLCRSDGQANPRLVAPSFAVAARSAGADIREETSLVHAERMGDRFALTTDTGLEVSAGILVNTAGAWGADVAAMFGERVPEVEEAPNMIVSEPIPYFLEPNVGVVDGDLYLRQIPRGNLIFGGGRGVADRKDIVSRPLAQSTLGGWRSAVEAVPAIAGVHAIRTWSGIEGYMPDDIPVIGPSTTTPGLFHAFGFSGHGFQLGPGMGELLAELVVEGRTDTPLDAFAVNRFNESEPNEPV